MSDKKERPLVSPKTQQLFDKKAKVEAGGGPERHAAQKAQGKLGARERIELLVDDDSFEEIDALVETRATDFDLDKKYMAADGVITGFARINGRPVCLYAQDFTVVGGSLGLAVLVLGLALATRRGDPGPAAVTPVAPPASPAATPEVPTVPPRSEPAPPPKVRPVTKIPIRDPRPTGYLRLASEPWAFVDLDGRRLDKPTPLLDYALPAGPHTLRLTNPEIGKTVELRIVIRPAETLTKRVSLIRP